MMGFLLKKGHCSQVLLRYPLLKIIKETKKEKGWRIFKLKSEKKDHE